MAAPVSDATPPPAPHEAPSPEETDAVAPQPTTELPRLILVSPACVPFDPAANKDHPQVTRKLEITNTHSSRISWRVLSNAPTRYVVSPSSGFLTQGEKMSLRVTLVDSDKFHRRHSFLVQAKDAPQNENNRKVFWKIPTPLNQMHNVRIKTKRSGVKSPGLNTAKDDTVSVSPSASPSKSAPQQAKTPLSPSKEFAIKADIDMLNSKVKAAMEAKAKEADAMVAIVNEVKKMEVDLDRAGGQAREVDGKLKACEAVNKDMSLRLVTLHKDLSSFKGGVKETAI